MQRRKLDPDLIVLGLCLLVVSFLSMPAQALNFTSECENWPITSSDRQLFEDAADLLDDYRSDVEDHINNSRLNGNPDNYTFIDPSMMSDWRDKVDDLQSGAIKVACEYDDMTFLSSCQKDYNKLGLEAELQPGRIHICIENVRDVARNPFNTQSNPVPGSAVALLAGVLAHELMHKVDGFATGHNGGTDPSNPQTAAETIGAAMENLILTPDLDTTVRSVDISCCDAKDHATVTFDVLLKNMNAEADLNLRSLADQFNASAAGSPNSGYVRNVRSTLRVELDGITQQRSVNPLNGSASTTESFVFSIPAYEVAGDGVHEILAHADSGNVFAESDERNNDDDASVSTAVDVALSLEVAAPPVCHKQVYRDDVYPPGFYNWIDIPFRAEVTNLDDDNTAPRVDVVMMYDDMWTDSAMTSQQVIWTDSLDPHGIASATFHLDVPTDRSCNGPLGDTDVWFTADGNAYTLNDKDRSNNSVILVVNDDYWQPDYVIREVAAIGIGRDTRTVSYAVRNIGPASAFTGFPSILSSTAVVDQSGTTTHFSAYTRALDPGEQQTFEASLPVDDCDKVTYLIGADAYGDVDEYDEDNNLSEIRLSPVTPGGICPAPTHANDDHAADYAWLNENGMDILYDKFDSLNTVEWGTDRANPADIGPGAPILDRIP